MIEKFAKIEVDSILLFAEISIKSISTLAKISIEQLELFASLGDDITSTLFNDSLPACENCPPVKYDVCDSIFKKEWAQKQR